MPRRPLAHADPGAARCPASDWHPGHGRHRRKIATRAQGFGLSIGYHNRNPPGSAHPYFDSLTAMAEWCDVLLCVAPGGASTRHLVNARCCGRWARDTC